jgi:hypothetical protein
MAADHRGFSLKDHVVSKAREADVDDDTESAYSDGITYGGGYGDGYYAPHMGKECFSHTLLKAIVLAAVVLLVIMVMCRMAGMAGGEPKSLVKHLADCGWVVYYRRGCGHCSKQKEVLGGNYKKYIECDENGVQLSGYTTKPPIACNSPQIKGFPFWYNTKTRETRLGFQGIGGDLQAMAQC